MTKKEYQDLLTPPSEFTPDQLVNQEDRTLLWGYTRDRNSAHTYLEEGVIHHVVYGYQDKLLYYMNSSEGVFSLGNLIPDKRIYPEACDLEFIKVLKERDYYLPFTTFQEDRPQDSFYGLRLAELKE